MVPLTPLTSSTKPIPIESEVQGNSWKSVDWDMLIRSLCVKLKSQCRKIHDYIYSRFQPHIKEEQYLRTRTCKFN